MSLFLFVKYVDSVPKNSGFVTGRLNQYRLTSCADRNIKLQNTVGSSLDY